MKEILPGVFTWSRFSEEKQYDFNGWYVASGAVRTVVDPPPCSEEVLAEIERRGGPGAIVLTNRDHTRAADVFAARFRAPILIHQADAPLVTVRIGGVFRHGEELPGGLRAVRVADAKSPGECGLLLRAANAIILGDALIGVPAGRLSMLPASKFADPAKAREGVRALLDHPFDAVLVGDGAPIPRGGRRAVEEFLARTEG
jgi:glyoxylase-like metal-dependent hydrolase (beta-lactamase superfamily II)